MPREIPRDGKPRIRINLIDDAARAADWSGRWKTRVDRTPPPCPPPRSGEGEAEPPLDQRGGKGLLVLPPSPFRGGGQGGGVSRQRQRAQRRTGRPHELERDADEGERVTAGAGQPLQVEVLHDVDSLL